jgi:hypothetical protein
MLLLVYISLTFLLSKRNVLEELMVRLDKADSSSIVPKNNVNRKHFYFIFYTSPEVPKLNTSHLCLDEPSFHFSKTRFHLLTP